MKILCQTWRPAAAFCQSMNANLTSEHIQNRTTHRYGRLKSGLTGMLGLALILSTAATAHAQCGGGTAGDCCAANGTPYCADDACCTAVCELDAYCCTVEWDACCVNLAIAHCPDLDGCHNPGPPGACVDNPNNCCDSHLTPGCSNVACCTEVCMQDPFCCDVAWDFVCASQALDLACGCFQSPSQTIPQPANFSCAGHCGGGAPSGCWCDEACCDFGDCCEDKGLFCAGCEFGMEPPAFYGDWCKGPCGGKSETGGCWCDEACFENGDCCSGVCNDCPELSICTSNPADLTGNGEVGVSDLLTLLGNWGPCRYERCAIMELCQGDFNHDDAVGVPDLLYLVSNWGG